jgi:hypothetical protein
MCVKEVKQEQAVESPWLEDQNQRKSPTVTTCYSVDEVLTLQL